MDWLQAKKTRNIVIENSNIPDNFTREISLAYSETPPFSCWNVIIRNNVIMSHFSRLSGHENIFLYGCTNVTLLGNYLENNYNTYNLLLERNGEIIVTRNIFVNGSFSIINTAKLILNNNNFINSGLRFSLKAELFVRYSSLVASPSFAYGGLTNIYNDVKSKSNPFANMLLRNKNSTLVELINSKSSGTIVTQDHIISYINSVIYDLNFASKHAFVNNYLLENGTARIYWDALVQRGFMDNNGNLLSVNTTAEKEAEEIRGLTRTILDELALDGRIYKSETNFFPRSLYASNNVFINIEDSLDSEEEYKGPASETFESYRFSAGEDSGSFDITMTYNNAKLSLIASNMFDKFFVEESLSSITRFRYLKNCVVLEKPVWSKRY
ncbi:hypothetical protein ABK040_008771 [Willaertia magna]